VKSSFRKIADGALRLAMTSAHQLMKVGWFVRRPRTFGAHALALTPERRVILVKLRYAPGWRLPGGGRAEEEDPRDAALRELREEIGMISHGEAQIACEVEQADNFRRDCASLLVVRDVRYRPPPWSLEVEAVTEAEIDRLPDDLAPVAARWLEALRSSGLGGAG
jgi:ADP-ribose pyrophosphatase YjhB (NUDIX family)